MKFNAICISAFLLLMLGNPQNLNAENHSDKPQLNVAKEAIELPFKAAEGALSAVFDLGNIVVTGKRLGSPFHEFVAGRVSSTSVVTKEDIERSGAITLPQALAQTPGVVLDRKSVV